MLLWVCQFLLICRPCCHVDNQHEVKQKAAGSKSRCVRVVLQGGRPRRGGANRNKVSLHWIGFPKIVWYAPACVYCNVTTMFGLLIAQDCNLTKALSMYPLVVNDILSREQIWPHFNSTWFILLQVKSEEISSAGKSPNVTKLYRDIIVDAMPCCIARA